MAKKKTGTDNIADSIIKNQIDLDRFGEGVKNKVIGILHTAQQEIIGQIAKIDPDGPTLTKWKQERMEKLNQKISEILDQAYTDAKSTNMTGIKQAIKTTAESTPALLNAAIGVNIFDVTLTPELLNSIATKTMIDGNVIGAWWDKQSADAKQNLIGKMNKISQEIQVGLVKGEAVGEMISRIRGTKLTPGIMSIPKREAAALVRTSVMQVVGETRKAIYKQNEDVLNGYEIIATLDTRTTPLCRGLDRKQYDLNFQPVGHSVGYPVGGPPFHWNCRSTLIPITKSYRELMEDDAGIPASKKKALLAGNPIDLRASMGGPVSGRMDYNEWLLEQTEAVQKSVLGDTRWALWKENKLAMEDLIHQDGRQLTLNELKKEIEKGAPAYRDAQLLQRINAVAGGFETMEDFQLFLDTMPEGKRGLELIEQSGETPLSLYNKSKQEAEKIVKQSGLYSWEKVTNKTMTSSAFEKFGIAKVSGDVAVVNSIGDDLAVMFSKYPALAEVMKKKGLDELSFLNNYVIKNGITGSFNHHKGTFYQIKAAVKNHKMYGPLKKGGFSAGNSVNQIFTHEFGHHVDKVFANDIRKEWKAIYESHSKEWWAKNVSKYSTANMYEGFAEVFSIYVHPEYSGGFLSSDVEIFLAKVLKKVDENQLMAAVKKADKDLTMFMKMSAEEKIAYWKEMGGIEAEILAGIPIESAGMTTEELAEYVTKKKTSGGVQAKYWKIKSNLLKSDPLASEAMEALAKEGTLPGDYKLQIQAIKGKMAELKIDPLVEVNKLISTPEAQAVFKANKSYADNFHTLSNSDQLKSLKVEIEKFKEMEEIWQKEIGLFFDETGWTIEHMKKITPNIDDLLSTMTNKEKYDFFMGQAKALSKIQDMEIAAAKAAKEAEEAAKASTKSLGGKKTYNLLIPEEKKQFEAMQNAYMQKYKAAKVAGVEPAQSLKAAYESLTAEQKELWDLKIQKAMGKIGEVPKPGVVEPPVMTAAKEAAKEVKELDINDFVKYGEQQGSNRGGFYYNKNNSADRFYIKIPENIEVARNEVLASKLYQAAGVEVPELQFIKVGDQTGIASRIVDDVEKIDLDKLKAGMIKGVGEGFVTDCWLADWDVVGLSYDNLLQKGGRAIRIDVGGSLKYRAQGGNKGAAFGKDVVELKTLRDVKSNPQSAKIFKHMKQSELEEGVRRVLMISDDQIKNLVAEYGPTSKAEQKELADILIARKRSIATQFPNVKVDEIMKPAPAPRFTGAINEMEHKQIISSRANGYSIDIDKEDIEDHNLLFWTEKISSKGETRTIATMKVRGEGANAINKLIKAVASEEGEKTFFVGEVYNQSLTAIKGIYTQIKKGSPIRAVDITRAKTAVKTYDDTLIKLKALKKEGRIIAQEIEAYQNYYEDHITFLRQVAASSEGKTMTIPAYADKTLQRRDYLDLIVQKKKEVEQPIKFKKVEGSFQEKVIDKGYLTATNRNVMDYEYCYEATIGENKVRYWPTNDERISFAHRGKLEVSGPGIDKSSVENILGTLKQLGISTERATELDDEILYLKQILYHAEPKKFDSIIAKAVGLDDEKAVVLLRSETSKACGVADITKVREYNPAGARRVFDQGFIYRERPDLVEDAAFQKFRREHVLVHSLTNSSDMAEAIGDILNSGGSLVATTNKLRIGMQWGGMSPSSDMSTGGASYVFTRIKSGGNALARGQRFVWDSDLLRRLDAISYTSDNYGRVTAGHVTSHRKTGVSEWAECSRGGSNETIFKNNLSLFDRLKYIVCNDRAEKDRVITIFKNHGYKRFPDGRELADVVQVRNK